MDLSEELPVLDLQELQTKKEKRKYLDEPETQPIQKKVKIEPCEEKPCASSFVVQHRSPRKRLNVQEKPKIKQQFIYGNYHQYYGYRNNNKDFHDVRLDVLENQKELFDNKEVLDIGCNSGFITLEVAKKFNVRKIIGIDIDRSLINQAQKQLIKLKKILCPNKEARPALNVYPFNVHFLHGNYVLRDDVLLEIEREQFDVILCLSITKWIHLNFGDDGLQQSFRRMFLQLRSSGKLILEAQPFDNYGRRKKMTETIFNNYKSIKFLPQQFTEYLLSSAVGFSRMEQLGTPAHIAKGFKRPIQIFYKT